MCVGVFLQRQGDGAAGSCCASACPSGRGAHGWIRVYATGWERRYGVVVPHRNESGYRLYGEQDLLALSTMRELVDSGWSPGDAAERS